MSELIPFHWYSNPDIYLREQKMFGLLPRYSGHILMVPNLYDYYTLESTNHSKMLVHNDCGVEILSNICLHRQAIMRQGAGNKEIIQCPAHCWKYSSEGKLVHTPRFKESYALSLKRMNYSTWNGLLFESQHPVADDLKNPYLNHIMDFSAYAFHSSVSQMCNYNWKIFINTYIEIYHVQMIHPGLRQFISCDDIKWHFAPQYSIQTVQMNTLWKEKAGSTAYQHLHTLLCEHTQENTLEYGAVWMMFYPNLMIEHYPNAIVVSQVIPQGVDRCSNIIEFYFPEKMLLYNHPYCLAFKNAYLETAAEDDEMCEKIHAGTKISAQLDYAKAGPIQPILEAGLLHFHKFLRQFV